MVEITDYPIQNFIGLLAKGNGNALDNLFQAETETSIHTRTKEVNDLKQITLEYLHNGFLNHCIGYDTSLANDMANPTRLERYGPQKLALCRYKILLEGMILANHREVCYNLLDQSNFVQTKYCLPLLSDYTSGQPPSDLSSIKGELDQLRAQLIGITEHTKLWVHGKESPLDQALEQWYLEYYAPSPKQTSKKTVTSC